jgi:hypothetical protein
MNVKRYEIDVVGDVGGPRFEMAEHATGDLVYYTDYTALESRVRELESSEAKWKNEWQASLGWKGAIVHGTRESIAALRNALGEK